MAFNPLTPLAVGLGRATRVAMRLRGGGSAMPGHVARTLDPNFLGRAVERLPRGVVFVTGSNGKSTTTAYVTSVLRGHGLRVFTNGSGGNMPQGIVSAMLGDVDWQGHLNADIAVLEVDEAICRLIAPALKPRVGVLLNVQVDHLNRFYDPARVANYLLDFAKMCGEAIVLNADDTNLRRIAPEMGVDRAWFGIDSEVAARVSSGLPNYKAPGVDIDEIPASERTAQVVDLVGQTATIEFHGELARVELPARGMHYAIDAAAALTAGYRLLGEEFSLEAGARALSTMDTVYGRGEIMMVEGQEIEIILMKNPPSLRMNLDALEKKPDVLMFAMDEGSPDPSWMYGIDLSKLGGVDITTGTKAAQIATFFGYQHLPVGKVIPNNAEAIRAFLALPAPEEGRKLIIANYEQTIALRRIMGQSGIEGKHNS